MWRKWEVARPQRDSRSDLQIALLAAPFVLLFIALLSVKTADSSASFRIDNRVVLENLKRVVAEAARAQDRAVVADVAERPARTAADLREVREIVRRGDTLPGILRRVGVSSAEVTRWSETTHTHVSLSRLQPGHVLTFLLPSGTDRLAGLQYEVSPQSTLVMRKSGESITASVERLPQMEGMRVVGGVIESSLYAAAARRGVPESVISSLVDIFGWDVDFSSDLQAGDMFRVTYEERPDVNGTPQGGRVIAAELIVNGRRWDAIYFEADDDGGSYYTPEGHALGRSFLRYPVEFTRISSQFTSSRFHPLLGVNRPHLGVDFAAPMGTPVRAIASGTVEDAGWKGGSGRCIRIDHGSGLESVYAHLQSISRGVRPGMRVQVGQVIGAVGASGLATGPHLHFAFFRNGDYVNPMTVKLPASPPLISKFRHEFTQIRDLAMERLAAAKFEGTTGSFSVASALPTSSAN